MASLPDGLLPRLIKATAVLWLAVRFALGTLGVVELSYQSLAGLVAIVLGAVWIDLRRNTEIVFYANLAVSPARVSLIAVTVTLALELAVGWPLSGLASATIAGLSP